MRHRVKDKKLGRSLSHREAVVAALVCALIEHKRIETTLAKAKCARSLAEKMVTLGRKQTLAARRHAMAVLRRKDCVKDLFSGIVPSFNNRNGGYTRIVKLGERLGDGASMAVLEWVGISVPEKKVRKSEEAGKPETTT